MEKASFTQIKKGSLLIASPEVDSGIFYRSIVLICEHSLSGTLGFILNKPIDLETSEALIEIEDLVNPNVELLAGGPLQMNQMMILHSKKIDGSMHVTKNVYLGGDLEFLQDSLSDEQGPSVRLLFGYSSWSSGQLEKEFLNGQWFATNPSSEIIFNTHLERMWQAVLQKMGGKYASLSMIPEDLSWN